MGQGLIPLLFNLYTGYQDFTDRHQEKQMKNLGEQLSLYQHTHPGENNPPPELANKINSVLGIKNGQQTGQSQSPMSDLSSFGMATGQQPQGAQQSPMQQLQGMGGGQPQPQPAQQPKQAPMSMPVTPFRTLNQQTGELSPPTYLQEGTTVHPVAASPKGITWMIDPTGQKPPVQTFEGDPKAQTLAQSGYVPMPLAVERERTKASTQQREKDRAERSQFHEDVVAGKEGSSKPSFADKAAMNAAIASHPEWNGQIPPAELPKILNAATGAKAEAGASGRQSAEFNALKSAGVQFDPQTGKIDIKTLPPEIRNTASMIASYQMPLPSGFALRSPYWQAVLAVTKDINPEFNAMEYEARKHALNAVNSPTFLRMRTNANILANPPIDQKTGKPTGESELDKIVEMRNRITPGVFGDISTKLRAFNSWDQMIDYQVSDPEMAKFKGILIANIERLGSVYQGGGTVTSDYKMRLAREFLDPALDKSAFKDLVEAHRESILRTLGDYSNALVGGLQGVPLQTPDAAAGGQGQSGQMKVVGGKTYIKQEDGLWHPQQ